MRPRKIVGELKALIEQDIALGKKRGVICKDHGVSYQQLQREFGFTCRKPRRGVTQETQYEPEPVN